MSSGFRLQWSNVAPGYAFAIVKSLRPIAAGEEIGKQTSRLLGQTALRAGRPVGTAGIRFAPTAQRST